MLRQVCALTLIVFCFSIYVTPITANDDIISSATKEVASESAVKADNYAPRTNVSDHPEQASATQEEEEPSSAKFQAAVRPEGKQGRTLKVGEIPIIPYILRKSPYYTVDSSVAVDGYFYQFVVHTDHGDYQAGSVRQLIKRCHEAGVIEHFRQTEQGSNFLKGLGQSVVGVGKGLGAAVRHPGQTIKRIGSGTGRFLRATGGFFTAPFRGDDNELASTGEDLALLAKGPAGGERRLLAFELGIDVYTRNENAKEFLNEVARGRLAGKLPIGAAVFALPGGAVFTLSLTPMGYDASTEELIRDSSPQEVLRELRIRYRDRFGFDYEDKRHPITKLLDNPNFTPRQQAYLQRYLTDLQAVDSIEDALRFLARVQTPDQASIVVAQVELLSLLDSRARPLEQFVPVNQTLGGRSKDGTLCLVISIDTVRFQRDVIRSLRDSINAAKAAGAKRIEIWSTGDIDEASVAVANRMGVVVYQNILKNPIFRRPRNEGDPTLWGAGNALQTDSDNNPAKQTETITTPPVQSEPRTASAADSVLKDARIMSAKENTADTRTATKEIFPESADSAESPVSTEKSSGSRTPQIADPLAGGMQPEMSPTTDKIPELID